MNKKYIDFVPKNGRNAVGQPKAQVIMPAKGSAKASSDISEAKSKRTPRLTGSDILGRGLIDAATKKKTLKAPVRNTGRVNDTEKKSVDEEMQRAVIQADTKKAERMKLPQARFVNTEKIDKRPLSKNVYQKKIVEPKEESQAPVTIIHKPEKDSRAGLIVTIIITIILGAAAGTVAFLLIPK